jgi:hypothetical protein
VIPLKAVGCPIRRSEDQRALAPPLGFSQRATSFIASRCQGIHQMPFSCCARAQPQARGKAACSRQHAECGGQPKNCLLPSDRCLLGPVQAPPRRCSRIGLTHTHAPGPTSPHDCGRPPDLLHGHDSLHDVIRSDGRGQMSDVRGRTRPAGPPAFAYRTPASCRSRTFSDVVLRHPSF